MLVRMGKYYRFGGGCAFGCVLAVVFLPRNQAGHKMSVLYTQHGINQFKNN